MSKVVYQLTVDTKKLSRKLKTTSALRSYIAKTLFELAAKVAQHKITVEYNINQLNETK